ncbi:MAG: SdpI family protein [Eubacteriales bacterium]
MKKNKFVLLLSILSLIGTAITYFYLPAEIPIHWDSSGNVDNWGPKWTLFITGALPLILHYLFIWLPKIDPKRENYKKHEKAYSITHKATIYFLILVQWVAIAEVLYDDFDLSLLIFIGAGILLIILGNYMPQFRHNYFVGIKTPWTLSDETVWKKTHQLGGYTFIILGLLFIVQGFVNHQLFGYGVTIVAISMVIGLFAYSYIIYKQIHSN